MNEAGGVGHLAIALESQLREMRGDEILHLLGRAAGAEGISKGPPSKGFKEEGSKKADKQ